MTASGSQPQIVATLLASTGLSLEHDDLDATARLYRRFAGQRARLTGAARPESEPMTIPAFDRVKNQEAGHERG